jgi:hypothetical protein
MPESTVPGIPPVSEIPAIEFTIQDKVRRAVRLLSTATVVEALANELILHGLDDYKAAKVYAILDPLVAQIDYAESELDDILADVEDGEAE